MPYRGLGHIPDRFDHRDYRYGAVMPPPPAVVPSAVDLRPFCGAIRDQGMQACCSGFALAALMEFLQLRVKKPLTVVSPAYIYYQERLAEDSIADCDAGAMLRDGLKALVAVGVCPESDAPYQDSGCGPPSAAAADSAALHKLNVYHRIETPDELKAALATGNAAAIGISVYASFEHPNAGHVSMPAPGEELLGGHAMLACGYRDAAGYAGGGFWIVRNSWGGAWGDLGYCYLPYAYFTAKLWDDAWTGA